MIKSYTWQEVRKHCHKNDCWVISAGKVYDVTGFIKLHPGGNFLWLNAASRNINIFINSYHFKGSAHLKLLEKYYIGNLIVDNDYPEAEKVEYYFHTELTQKIFNKVSEYFSENNISPRFSWEVCFKWFFLFCLSIAAWYFLCFTKHTIFSWIINIAVSGIATASLVMNSGHDGAHGSLSKNQVFNHLGRYMFDLFGGVSSYMWIAHHNVGHHRFPNINNQDPTGADGGFFLRYYSAQPHHWWHRWQPYYAILLYALHIFNWIFITDFRWVMGDSNTVKLNTYGALAIPTKELFMMLGCKVFFLGYWIFIPWIFSHQLWLVLLNFFCVWCVISLIITLKFAVEHFTDKTVCRNKITTRCWASAILETTCNIGSRSFLRGRILSFFFGGLNYHIEHHLLPGICHTHLKKIAPLIQTICSAYRVEYKDHASFWAALISHWRHLSNMARPHH